jgi:DNA-binding NarL/FixJ family response regulator
MPKIRVLLADDHHLFREGLANLLDAQPDFEVVGEAADGLEVLVMARQLRPDLILMDITMPGYDGVEATGKIKDELPEIIIVMLTVANDDERLFEAVRSGAQGYLLKTVRSMELVALLRGTVRGEAALTPAMAGRLLEEFRRLGTRAPTSEPDETTSLTPRELEVLRLVAMGDSNDEIASSLTISVHTVKSHIRNILAKLQVSQRQEAARYAQREGLLPRPPDPQAKARGAGDNTDAPDDQTAAD